MTTDKLPPRGHTVPSNEQGLYQKYTVHRTDGKVDEPGTEYLVLKWNDPNAVGAILTFADAVQDQNPKLARELRHKLENQRRNSDDPR